MGTHLRWSQFVSTVVTVSTWAVHVEITHELFGKKLQTNKKQLYNNKMYINGHIPP